MGEKQPAHVCVWSIASGGPEDFDYVGTEQDAEAMRRHRAKAEGCAVRKTRAGVVDMRMAERYCSYGPFSIGDLEANHG